jgi:DNA topoisomerase-1
LKKLIIVESPTKARTIGQYLGKEYDVLSSQGHVRDLPKNGLGVDVDKEFAPKFETKRSKLVTQLRDAARDAERVFLATDHDREGEAIAYDLFTILNRVVKDEEAFARPVFNEITKPVILDALKSPGSIDLKKVEAQRTRRILDRLVGYLVSPLLSRTIAGNRFAGLSAGRVQSVALRFLCDREAEITAFVPEEYWEIDARLTNGEPFVASVTKRDGEKLPIRNEAEAEAVTAEVRAASEIRVTQVEEKERRRNPSAPFITSTLQQAASSRLGFGPKRTMRIAQELYEGIALPGGTEGLITYMRTDSVRVSEAAVAQARDVIASTYGKEYLSPKPRTFKNKRRSQDAHEAIRPTDEGRTPESIEAHLSADQRKLYALIHGRFLATQMAPAVYRQRKIVLSAGPYTLEASGSALEFDGFLRALPDARTKESPIPADVREGDRVTLEGLETRQKFTEPPRRYSEAGLINLLEREGIGRPSTYASIVSVIQDRGYAVKDGGSLRPTLLGQMVVDFLRRHFAETVNPRFTAHLEEDLDEIEEGDMSRLEALNEFYGPFSERLAALEASVEGGGDRVFQVPSDVTCDVCGSPMELRYWKGSFFLGCTDYPTCRNTVNLPPDLRVQYGADGVKVKEALAAAAAEHRRTIPCPACGGEMEMKTGRFGRYYKCTDPDCGETASVSTGVTCPSCGEGELVEKYSAKRRRTFYSCSRYPDCRYAVSERPVKPCPACGAGVLVEKKDGELRCTNKECGYREPSPSSDATPPRTEA